MLNRTQCYGCGACAVSCPMGALVMVKDRDGFVRPKIYKSHCIKCGACERACYARPKDNALGEGFIAQAEDEDILKRSTSGGVIPKIAEMMIEAGGVVCAAAYHLPAGGEWKIIDNIKQLPSITGSKYFQIDITQDKFRQIRDAIAKRPMLFIGTPCQVSAVREYLGIKYQDRLLTIDLICGGVTSENFEKRYIAWEQKQKGGSGVSEHLFRSKEKGWTKKYTTELRFEDGSQTVREGSDSLFTLGYNSGMFLRHSCYNCDYCSDVRTGDITVGDCWGIEDTEFDACKGISMVFLNTKRGREAFAKVKGIQSVKGDSKTLVRQNKPLYERHKRRLLRSVSYPLIRLLGFRNGVNIAAYRYHLKRLLKRG